MSEPEELAENQPTPDQVRANRHQVWLTLLVMLGSSCVSVTVLMVILWFLLKKVLPPGGF